jgi:glycosyltransferase involved in cell wall biosynthesis
MEKRISVIVPNYNGSGTIGKCLEAVFSSDYESFDVIVVDDCSTDDSVEIIRRFPCRLVTLDRNSGASVARNTGARNSSGDVLFFIDADCIVQKDTLSIVDKTITGHEDTVFGGTYSRVAFDDNFFGTFQSVFIHWSETKRKEPDYIATHAMVIRRKLFEKSGGFQEDFLPILEDVEFSHRLRKSGIKLKMNPEITVKHIFNFTLGRSLRNAFKKTKYWTIYSLRNRDLLSDSGTASRELKFNVVSFFFAVFLVLLFSLSEKAVFLATVPPVCLFNLFLNRRLISSLYETKGGFFAFLATFYYTSAYPLAIGAGALTGLMKYHLNFGGGQRPS